MEWNFRNFKCQLISNHLYHQPKFLENYNDKQINKKQLYIFIYIQNTIPNQIHKIKMSFFFFFLVMPCLDFDHIERFDYQPELKGVLSWFWLYSSILLLFWWFCIFVLVLSRQSWPRTSTVQFVHYTSNFWTTLLLLLLTSLFVG